MREPNTHILGYYMAVGWIPGKLSEIIRGYKRRGWYEKRIIETLGMRKLTRISLPTMVYSLAIDAFASYLYNIIISTLIEPNVCIQPAKCVKNEKLIEWRKSHILGHTLELPYASTSVFSYLKLSLEAIPEKITRSLRRLLLKRPLIGVAEKYRLMIDGDRVEASFILPPGSYATSLLYSEGLLVLGETREG